MADGILTRRGGGLKPEQVRAWAKYSLGTGGTKGDFVEIVYSKIGDFPADGVQDGFWYTLIDANLFSGSKVKSIQRVYREITQAVSSLDIPIEPVNPECCTLLLNAPVYSSQYVRIDNVYIKNATTLTISSSDGNINNAYLHVTIIEFEEDSVKSWQGGVVAFPSGGGITINISPINAIKSIPFSSYTRFYSASSGYRFMRVATLTNNTIEIRSTHGTTDMGGTLRWEILELK
jgi:hypothetical protein